MIHRQSDGYKVRAPTEDQTVRVGNALFLRESDFKQGVEEDRTLAGLGWLEKVKKIRVIARAIAASLGSVTWAGQRPG